MRVWPADGGDAVILVGHEGAVNTAAFDARGDRVVSAGDDGTIRVWDAAGGDALVVLHRHEGTASGADFGAGGRDVVSAGDDGMRITACEVCGSVEDVLRVARTRAAHAHARAPAPAGVRLTGRGRSPGQRRVSARGQRPRAGATSSKLDAFTFWQRTTAALRRTQIATRPAGWPSPSAGKRSTMSAARISM